MPQKDASGETKIVHFDCHYTSRDYRRGTYAIGGGTELVYRSKFSNHLPQYLKEKKVTVIIG